MEIADKYNGVRKEWLRNFAIGLALTGPLLITPMGRLFMRRSSGVPYYYR